jgi:hypothetical protein
MLHFFIIDGRSSSLGGWFKQLLGEKRTKYTVRHVIYSAVGNFGWAHVDWCIAEIFGHASVLTGQAYKAKP